MFWNRKNNTTETKLKRNRTIPLLLLVTIAFCDSALGSSTSSNNNNVTDTWAVIVNSSRFWLNYRHTANALGLYRSLRTCVRCIHKDAKV